MPFKTREYDRAFAVVLGDLVYELALGRSALLSQIRVEASAGAVSSVVDSREGGRLDQAEQLVGFELTFDLDMIRAGDRDALLVQLDAASDELARGLVGGLIENVSEMAEHTGNVVKGSGVPTFELFYEALSSMEWSLTDDGELSMPQIVMHPDMVEAARVDPGAGGCHGRTQAQKEGGASCSTTPSPPILTWSASARLTSRC